MNNNGLLIMLPAESLKPHPDNPRRDLGDLSELTESIKAQGVLQNLTVVPEEDGFYKVIIGHRRLAAAKAAGLEEIPCVITDMSEKEQLATMLTENMQRADLTIYEQAKAFQQLSLDLGMSIKEISEKSGFSDSTIRKRVKLAEFGEKSFYDACKRGATLFDFEQLDKLEDPEAKKEILKYIGTNNFENELKRALTQQKNIRKIKKQAEQLEVFATEIKVLEHITGIGYQCEVDDEIIKIGYCGNYHGYGPAEKDVEIPEDADSVRYFFKVYETGIDLYKEKIISEAEEEQDRIKEENKRKETVEFREHEEIVNRHKELRGCFVKNFNAVKSNSEIIMKTCAKAVIFFYERRYYIHENYEELCKFLNISYDKETQRPSIEEFDRIKEAEPERLMLIITWWILEINAGYSNRRWMSDMQRNVICYREDKKLDTLYSFLEQLGYEKSNEEIQIRNGTHPLYFKEDSEAAE